MIDIKAYQASLLIILGLKSYELRFRAKITNTINNFHINTGASLRQKTDKQRKGNMIARVAIYLDFRVLTALKRKEIAQYHISRFIYF